MKQEFVFYGRDSQGTKKLYRLEEDRKEREKDGWLVKDFKLISGKEGSESEYDTVLVLYEKETNVSATQ